MSVGIRGRFKQAIPTKCWPIFRFIDKYLIYILYIYLAGKRSISRVFLKRLTLNPQSIPRLAASIDLGASSDKDLAFCLQKANITFKSGRHSVYIDSPTDITKISLELIDRYPVPFALKLIKSQEISPDFTPYYTSNRLAPASTWFSMVAVGSMLEQSVVSNLLHEQGVAPRVYDIVRLESQKGDWCYGYIVQPITGDVVTGEKGIQFISHFKEVMNTLGLDTISIKEHCDLRPPEFRHNIRFDETGMYYVDIQNFAIASTRYGADLLGKMKKRSAGIGFKIGYNSMCASECIVPGFKGLLERYGIDLEEAACLDYCMPEESFVVESLVGGCRWCYVFRHEEEAELVRQYLYYHSYSRLEVVGCSELSPFGIIAASSFPLMIGYIPSTHCDFGQALISKYLLSCLFVVGVKGESEEDLIKLVQNKISLECSIDSSLVNIDNIGSCAILFLKIQE